MQQNEEQKNIFTFDITPNLQKEPITKNLQSSQQIIKAVIPSLNIVEDFSHKNDNDQIYLRNNRATSSLFEAIFLSYSNHYNLKLSVSDFLIAIGQALSIHINENSEKLRKEFVSFEGKQEIIVRRDEFVLGKANDWSTVFAEFSEQIKEKTNVDVNNIIIDNTSVATETSKIVSQICLMESMKSYFEYTVYTKCGIPKISLKGTPEDWMNLKEKVDSLCKLNENDRLGLDWWLKHLVPVIDKIVNTCINRKVDISFWESFAKTKGGSGGPYFNGWINVFYPYLAESEKSFFKNPNMEYNNIKPFSGLKDNQIPKGISYVPFIWNYLGKEIEMDLYGGFFATKVIESENSVEPELFWVVNRKN